MVVTGLVGVLSAMHERERERTTAVKPGALHRGLFTWLFTSAFASVWGGALEAGGPLRLPRLC